MSAMQQTQVALPSPGKLFTRGVTGILILSIAGYLVFVLAPDFAAGVLGVSAGGIRRGMVWQVVTYPFVHGSPMNLVFNGMVILFVGSAIEREWRTASFVSLWLVVSIACGLIWVGVGLLTRNNMVGLGATACCYGFIGTMGLLHRGKRFFVLFASVEAQHLALILIAIGIILNIMTPITLVWIAGALVAYLYVKAHWSHARREPTRSRPHDTGGGGRFVDID
jgi:membrane associated rhomboid family serine protease